MENAPKEETLNNKVIDVEIIPLDAKINLTVSGEFVARLSTLLTGFFPYKDQNHFNELVKHVKEETNQDDPYVYNFTTLVALQSYIEQEAKLQNLTKVVKYDTELKKVIEEESQPSLQVPEQPE